MSGQRRDSTLVWLTIAAFFALVWAAAKIVEIALRNGWIK